MEGRVRRIPVTPGPVDEQRFCLSKTRGEAFTDVHTCIYVCAHTQTHAHTHTHTWGGDGEMRERKQ